MPAAAYTSGSNGCRTCRSAPTPASLQGMAAKLCPRDRRTGAVHTITTVSIRLSFTFPPRRKARPNSDPRTDGAPQALSWHRKDFRHVDDLTPHPIEPARSAHRGLPPPRPMPAAADTLVRMRPPIRRSAAALSHVTSIQATTVHSGKIRSGTIRTRKTIVSRHGGKTVPPPPVALGGDSHQPQTPLVRDHCSFDVICNTAGNWQGEGGLSEGRRAGSEPGPSNRVGRHR